MNDMYLFPVGQDVKNFRTSILLGEKKEELLNDLVSENILLKETDIVEKIQYLETPIRYWGLKDKINMKENDICIFIYRGTAIGIGRILGVMNTINTNFSDKKWSQRTNSQNKEEWSYVVLLKQYSNIAEPNFFELIGYNTGFTLRNNQRIDDSRISSILDTLLLNSIFNKKFMNEVSDNELIISIEEKEYEK